MRTSTLIENLFNTIKVGIPYSTFLSDAENMDDINTALENSGCAVVVSRVATRNSLSTTNSNNYLRSLNLPILIFTNPATEGYPDVNDVMDALEKVISSLAIPGSLHYWKLDIAAINEDAPQNAYLILEYIYNIGDL